MAVSLQELETREKLTEERFRTFRNVNRQPFLFGLPWDMAVPFFSVSVVFILITAFMWFLGGHWVVFILTLLTVGIVYFLLAGLIEKHGVNYPAVFVGYHTSNLFKGIRINKKLRVFTGLRQANQQKK